MRQFITFGRVDQDIIEITTNCNIFFVSSQEAKRIAARFISLGYKITDKSEYFVTLYKEGTNDYR